MTKHVTHKPTPESDPRPATPSTTGAPATNPSVRDTMPRFSRRPSVDRVTFAQLKALGRKAKSN